MTIPQGPPLNEPLLDRLARIADRAGDETSRGRADRELQAHTPPLVPDDDPHGPTAPTPADTALSWAFAYRTEHKTTRPSSRVTFRPFLETSFNEPMPPQLADVPGEIVEVGRAQPHPSIGGTHRRPR